VTSFDSFHVFRYITVLCLLFQADDSKLLSGGKLLVKLWQGRDTSKVMNAMQKCFSDVRIVKPAASRANSAEIYLLAQGFSLEVNQSNRTNGERREIKTP